MDCFLGEEHHQVPDEESSGIGCGHRQCFDGTETVVREHHSRCQLPRFPSKEELAECQVSLHQEFHGKTTEDLLSMDSSLFSIGHLKKRD